MFRERVRVSIPVFFECDPSIIYGVFDTLWAAGKVWDTVQGGVPEGGLFEPRLVAAQPGPLELITGVSIVPQDTVDERYADRCGVRAERDRRAREGAERARPAPDRLDQAHARAGRADVRHLRRRARARGGRDCSAGDGDDPLGL